MHWLLIQKILATPLLILIHTILIVEVVDIEVNINVPCSGDYGNPFVLCHAGVPWVGEDSYGWTTRH